MPELKTTREIQEVLERLTELKQYCLALLCKWNVEQSDNRDLYWLTFERIDEDFMYPMSWQLFEMHYDTELLYEEYHVEEFIDIVYQYYYTLASQSR